MRICHRFALPFICQSTPWMESYLAGPVRRVRPRSVGDSYNLIESILQTSCLHHGQELERSHKEQKKEDQDRKKPVVSCRQFRPPCLVRHPMLFVGSRPQHPPNVILGRVLTAHRRCRRRLGRGHLEDLGSIRHLSIRIMLILELELGSQLSRLGGRPEVVVMGLL